MLRRVLNLIAVLGLLGGGAPTTVRAHAPDRPPIVDGVLDLRGHDFATMGAVTLDGPWIFYWRELVRPGEEAPPPTGRFHFPRLWNDEIVGETTLSAQGFATYRLQVRLPSDAPPLALTVEDAFTSFELWANGQRVAGNGRVGRTAGATRPHWLPATVRVPPATDGTLDLTLLIANFHHAKGGSNQSMLLGEATAMQRAREQTLMRDMGLMGCMVMGGLFFLGLFLFGSHERSVLYFALFCLAYSYRIGGANTYALHTLWPSLPWWLTARLEYLALFLSGLFFVRYTRALYPGESHRWVLSTFSLVSLAAAAITLFAPARIFTVLATPYVMAIPVFMAYATAVYVRAALNRRPGARYALASTITLFVVFGANTTAYLSHWHVPILLNFGGYIGFFFLQSLILSYRFAHHLREAKERAEQSARAKSDFLSMISHEIRTPLNGVIGLTHVLLHEDPTPQQRGLLDSLKHSAEHLLGIINGLLDFNKIDAGRVVFEQRPTDLAALLRAVHATFAARAEAKGIGLHLNLDPMLPASVVCDATRTTQVITNLVDNALKFTAEGSVATSLRIVNQDQQTVTLTVAVADTGIGIPPEQQQRIFEDFVQATSATTRVFGGTGLGLAITKRLLALQDVDLKLESEEGRGTRFFFTQTFPLTPAAPEPPPESREELIVTLPENLRVLLVEDNTVNATVARRMLTRWGATVDHATNGAEALERAREHRYDIILMDLHMPVMDGFAAATELRRRGISTPIIALTATAVEGSRERVRAIGMEGMVVKPFSPDSLRAEIARLTQGRE